MSTPIEEMKITITLDTTKLAEAQELFGKAIMKLNEEVSSLSVKTINYAITKDKTITSAGAGISFNSGDDRKGIVAKHPNDGGIALFGSSVITSGTIKPHEYKPTKAEQRANQVYILMSQMGMSSEEAIAALNDMERSGDKR